MNHEVINQKMSCLPIPLTRRNSDGEIYQRLAVVDSQIQEILNFEPEELQRRLDVTDQVSPDFLKEESLVYLIRHYHKEKDKQRVTDLSECLLTRCAIPIDRWLGSLESNWRKDANADVVAELFDRILDLDSDRGDFLQVRFWVVLEKLCVQVFRRYIKPFKHELLVDDKGEDIDALTLNHEIEQTHTLTRTVELEAIEWAVIREALSQLEEPFRSAYILRHYLDWPIEDQDPAVRTISQHFNKTPRTIRNWFSRAEKCLAAWRGEQK